MTSDWKGAGEAFEKRERALEAGFAHEQDEAALAAIRDAHTADPQGMKLHADHVRRASEVADHISAFSQRVGLTATSPEAVAASKPQGPRGQGQ